MINYYATNNKFQMLCYLRSVLLPRQARRGKALGPFWLSKGEYKGNPAREAHRKEIMQSSGSWNYASNKEQNICSRSPPFIVPGQAND